MLDYFIPDLLKGFCVNIDSAEEKSHCFHNNKYTLLKRN